MSKPQMSKPPMIFRDFSPQAFGDYLKARIGGTLDAQGEAVSPLVGDHSIDGRGIDPAALAVAKPAAVLVPVVMHDEGVTLLLTQRASALRQHSGQVAFPGGKIDEGESALAAALREAEEEIGLAARHIAPVGVLDQYLTGTGYRITPIVALVEPSYSLAINRHEVDDAFEVPLRFLFDPANHVIESREWKGRVHSFYAMPHGTRYIWGVTAGIIRRFYERLN